MPSFLKHLFYPQSSNNHRPKILHLSSIFVITVILLFSIIPLSQIRSVAPSVLGATSDISFQDLLILTNEQRAQSGVSPLTLNSELSKAARAKAMDMFEKNYWSHISPDGTTPWVFIKNAGYDYVYAGENLARGFTNANDVINAWMASPEHRSNMLSRNFQEVGFAVERGNLTGENTILIVEELGSKKVSVPQGSSSALTSDVRGESKTSENSSLSQSSFQFNPSINSITFSKNIIFIILGVFIATFLLDLIVIERKKIVRFTGHNLDHIFFLGILFVCIFFFGRGVTL